MARSALINISILCLLMGTFSCSDPVSVDEYLAQAKVFSAKKDHDSAIILLKNAVRLDIQNANVRFMLATSYLEQGDYLNAEKEFEKAETLGFSDQFLNARLIEVKSKLSKVDEVYAIVEKSKDVADEELIIILTYAGITAMYEDDREKARDYIDMAIGISDNATYSQLGKIYLSSVDLNPENNSLAAVNEFILANPDFTEALLLKGYFLQSTLAHEQAAEVFTQYSKLRPKELQIHFLIAQNYLSAKKYISASPEVDALLKMSALHPIANQMKAEIEFQNKNFQIAKDHAVIALQQNEQLLLSKIIAGISAYNLKEYEQAYHYLSTLKNRISKSDAVTTLLLDLQIKLGYDEEALSSLGSISNIGEIDPSMLTNASFQLLQSGNTAAAQEMLKSSMGLDRQNPTELAKQGFLQIQFNQAQKGIELLEQSLKLDPDSALAQNSLAVGYLKAEQLDSALTLARKWQGMENKLIQGYLLESSILHKQNKVNEAKTLLKKVVSFDATNLIALYKLAMYAQKETKIQQAFDYYVKVIDLQPQHMGAVRHFVILVKNNKEFFDSAVKYYQANIEKSPNDDYAKLGLAYLYRVNNEHDLSIGIFKEMLTNAVPLEGIEVALGDSYKLLGQLDSAIKNYKKYAVKHSSSLAIVQKLISAYELNNQIDKAIEEVEKGLVLNQGNKGLILLKVYYQSLMKIQPSQKMLDELQEAEAIQEHWLLERTLGNLAYYQKDFAAASEHYKNSYNKNNNESDAVRWSKAEGLKGNLSAAINILEQHLKTDEKSIAIKVMLAGGYLNNKQFKQSLNLYHEIIELDPNNLIVLNNLSYLELQNKNNANALEFSQQAIKLAPENPLIMDTYGQALVANNQISLAIAEFDKALVIVNGNVEISIHKAKALIENKQQDSAKTLLLSLVDMTKDENKQVSELLALLN